MNKRLWLVSLVLLLGCAVLAAPADEPEKKKAPEKKEPEKKGPPFGPGGFPPFGKGPGGPGGPGGAMGQVRKLVKQFDNDGDGRLNKEERKAARAFLKKERAGGKGGFGPGGPKGKGGFGMGNFVAKLLLEALDADKDGKLTRAELTAGVERFFKRADKDKKGELDEKALADELGRILPVPKGFGPPCGGRGDRLAGVLVKRADANKDGKVTLKELVTAAEALFKEADKDKKGTLDESAVVAAVNILSPPPKFGKGGFGKGSFGPGGMSAGNTGATPISDGKYVATVFGNGVVAVYTLDGQRAWGKFVESPRLMFGHASSPLLLQGKLIVHVKDLVALDVATGKEAWRVALPASHASPVATRLGKEDVIISPAGAVVRARDGKVLAREKFSASQSSPVVHGDTIFLFGATLEALKLSQGKGGEVTVESLWKRDGAREMHHLPSPLVHDGLLYGVTTAGLLDAIDAKTGKAVYRQRLGGNQYYGSVALAGKLLYAIDTSGRAVVFKPGRRYERVAVNKLEETGSCPVFVGGDLYLRGKQNLYCVSAKDRPNGSE